MKFYLFCFCVTAVLLLVFPMLEAKPKLKKAENFEISEEKLVAVVEPVENLNEKISEESFKLPKMEIDEIKNLKIQNLSTKKIEKVELETFVLGAICSEMPATFHLEALKAQAVSARTWAVYQQLWQKNHKDESLNGADFSADPQNWKGYVLEKQAKERFGEKFDEYWEILNQAVNETKGQVICFENQPIAAAYHAISAGKTENAEFIWGNSLPYLQAVQSADDELAPNFQVSKDFTSKEIKEIFNKISFENSENSWLEILEKSPSSYVTKIRVGSEEMSGLEFRNALNLRSSSFTIKFENGIFTITTKGYGHGAGLSQYGADFMARQGYTYREILAHYYKNTELFEWK